jgi:hypothetical protein
MPVNGQVANLELVIQNEAQHCEGSAGVFCSSFRNAG